jgi:hypothetical protein
VTGTTFDAEYDTPRDQFLLDLQRGSVVVSGCGFGEGRTVVAVERVTASCRVVDALGSAPPASSETPASGENRREPGPPRVEAIAPSWIDLARQGHYAAAYELVHERFEAVAARRPLAEVQLLGDVARRSGHAADARRAYLVLRDRFPNTIEAANAAFTLGRLALEAGADPPEGERWFQTSVRERPDGPLASAARGRLLELYLQRGDRADAVHMAREYLDHHPGGPRALEAKRLVDDADGQR